jgi:hypothetical protein
MPIIYIHNKDTKERCKVACVLMQQKENVANCEG